MSFDKWDSRGYLETYFPDDISFEPTMEFIIQQRNNFKGKIGVEIGCGPTVCYFSAAAKVLKGIYVSDFLDKNLEEIKKWMIGKGYNWDNFFRIIQMYEGSDEAILKYEREVKKKVLGLLHCDIRKNEIFKKKFDFVMSFYCADSITDDKKKWREYFTNILRVVKPGGFFIGGALYRCKKYMIDDIEFPSANLDENDVRNAMLDAGMHDLTVKVVTDSIAKDKKKKEQYNYEKVILMSGFKKS
ncbi:MAG: methyltransferase domain-containing protein [Nanoarchaeota archaeon]